MNDSLDTAERLAEIGRENDLAEIEYEDATTKIHITFDPPPAATFSGINSAVLADLAMANSGGQAQSVNPVPDAGVKSQSRDLGETINSPLAGVFYRSSNPDADSFVAEGADVATGQVLCIVEAMKLMNEITAERPCKISKILVENAEAVEEGQPLFLIS